MKWEFDILYALQKIHQPVLDHIMTGLSTIGNAGILYLALRFVFRRNTAKLESRW